MFNFGGGILAGQHDCKKERPPPARPIPVTFPSLTPPQPSLRHPPSAWTNSPSAIPAHLLKLRKPADVSLETLSLLNVTFNFECDFETIIPSSSDSVHPYLPPKSWLEAPAQDEPKPSPGSGRLLSNGRRVPGRDEFYVRAKELFPNNGDAFAALTRKANPGQVPPRLAHFRKFWEGLDNLAYYWDNSLDEYLPPKEEDTSNPSESRPDSDSVFADIIKDNGIDGLLAPGVVPESISSSANTEEPRKKAKTEAIGDVATISSSISGGFGDGAASATPISISSSTALPARMAPPKVPWAMNMQSISQRSADLSKGSYRGYRIGNGAEMPDGYRLDCVRAFLEPIAWPFAVTLVPHRRPPALCLENVRFPVRMSTVAWRGPTDRLKARQGWLEGPVIGIQCRAETAFGSTGDIQAESVLDAARELGGMLLLAQERAREGKAEKRAGEGKWWTTKRRWGGGPGGEIGEAAGASDGPTPDAVPQAEVKPLGRSKPGLTDRRRPSPSELWKTVKSGNPLWDPKIVYEAIGRVPGSDWDEIFMVSSLNHHISVLKLRVHRLYLQYLETGKLPEEEPSDPRWHSPTLERTRWFDLFKVEDRTEAMRGLWGIIAYLMRFKDEPEAEGTMKEA